MIGRPGPKAPGKTTKRPPRRRASPRTVIKGETREEQELHKILFGRIVSGSHLIRLTMKQKRRLAIATKHHGFNNVRRRVNRMISEGLRPGEPAFDKELERVLPKKSKK